MLMHYPRLRHFNENGGLRASDALVLCFYMRQPNIRIAPALVRALKRFCEVVQPYSFLRYVGDGQTEPLDESAWKERLQEVLEPGPETAAFLIMEGETGDVNALHLDYRGLDIIPLPWPERKHDVSVLYIRLPTQYLEERGPEHVRALALELAAELPFNSGYVDLALCTAPWNFDEVLPLIHPHHPGIHLASRSAHLRMDTWVDGVHWMNFLGAPVLDQLGGAAGLRRALPLPGISIEELDADRVLITLGEHPDPGDPQTGQRLPRHRALARLLEPYLHHWPASDSQVATAALRRWERRFLDEPEPGPI